MTEGAKIAQLGNLFGRKPKKANEGCVGVLTKSGGAIDSGWRVA
jgi:hypothetical protein